MNTWNTVPPLQRTATNTGNVNTGAIRVRANNTGNFHTGDINMVILIQVTIIQVM